MSQSKRQYEFLYPLSKTPFADVYRCNERHQGRVVRDVVIKILRENWSDNKESVLLLRKEISLLQSLHHPSIPKVYEVTAIRGRIAIVMEWMDGLDLKSLVQGMRKMKQRIPLKVTLALVADIASTLDVIYNQSPSPGKAPVRVLHGNLKPSNIILDVQGKVSLLDFGMNRTDLGGRESSTREMQFDSMEYMAPERLFFEPQASASDIYSLSNTMFEMLAGKPLVKAPPSEEKHQARVERYCQHLLRPMPLGLEVKEELSNLMISGMSYNANERPSSHEFALRARRLSTTVEGVQANQWAHKAIGYFQARMNRGSLQGTLQGSVLAEDTEVFQRKPSPNEPDVDTSIMRRGAVADFVEASLDLKPDRIVEVNDDEREPTDSLSFESSDLLSEPVLQVGVSVKVPEPPSMPQMMSSYSQDDFQSRTLTTDLEATQTSTTSSAFDIRPQAMAAPKPSEDGVSTKNLVMLFLGGAFLLLLGIYIVVTLFGETASEPTPTPTEISVPTPGDDDAWTGVRFVSAVPDTKKISVSCESSAGKKQKKTGSKLVTFKEASGLNCVVTVRTVTRQKFMTPVDAVTDGIYRCFVESEKSCVWEAQ